MLSKINTTNNGGQWTTNETDEAGKGSLLKRLGSSVCGSNCHPILMVGSKVVG